ncbi:hypothetical protein BD779DRAFT_1483340, partial [Infundibulicybe gibba]
TLSQLSTYGIAPQHGSARTQYFLTRDPNVPRPTPTATRTNITARASMRPGHLDNVPIRLPDSGHDRRSIASYIDPYIRRDSPTRESSRVSPSEFIAQFRSLRVDYPRSLQESHVALLHVHSHSRSRSVTKSPDRSQRSLAYWCVVYLVGFCGLFWPQASLHINAPRPPTSVVPGRGYALRKTQFSNHAANLEVAYPPIHSAPTSSLANESVGVPAASTGDGGACKVSQVRVPVSRLGNTANTTPVPRLPWVATTALSHLYLNYESDQTTGPRMTAPACEANLLIFHQIWYLNYESGETIGRGVTVHRREAKHMISSRNTTTA